MSKYILATAVALVSATIVTTAAHATTGRDAVGTCIDRKGCLWTVHDDGSITILTDDGTFISCPGAEAQCTVLRKRNAGSTAMGAGNKMGVARK